MSQFEDDGDELMQSRMTAMLFALAKQRKQRQEYADKTVMKAAEKRRFGWKARLARWLESL